MTKLTLAALLLCACGAQATQEKNQPAELTQRHQDVVAFAKCADLAESAHAKHSAGLPTMTAYGKADLAIEIGQCVDDVLVLRKEAAARALIANPDARVTLVLPPLSSPLTSDRLEPNPYTFTTPSMK